MMIDVMWIQPFSAQLTMHLILVNNTFYYTGEYIVMGN